MKKNISVLGFFIGDIISGVGLDCFWLRLSGLGP